VSEFTGANAIALDSRRLGRNRRHLAKAAGWVRPEGIVIDDA